MVEVGAPGVVRGVTVDELEAGPVPAAFVAATVTEYCVPLVRPVIVQLVPVVAQVFPPGLTVTVYPLMGEPPSLAGAFQLTVACPAPAVVLMPVGAPGADRGVTVVAMDCAPAPAPLTARMAIV